MFDRGNPRQVILCIKGILFMFVLGSHLSARLMRDFPSSMSAPKHLLRGNVVVETTFWLHPIGWMSMRSMPPAKAL